MNQIQLSVEEALSVAQFNAHWDGFVAGAKAAADAAKQAFIRDLVSAKAQPQTPTQEVPNVPTE